MKKNCFLSFIFCLSSFVFCLNISAFAKPTLNRIINIVNFIRNEDYRLENSENLLFEATEKQIELLNNYGFSATFLLQYDALINPKYQNLLKTKLEKHSEIGAWWEITQPHVEAAGLKWRGEHRWVSHANIAFTTGYTPEEREKLVDVYMETFKTIFGFFPKSVGSWFIDAHTLRYMYEKYGIVASCNCKDQIGTDGYTLWGGYWNQAYYPSKQNAYMPAQNAENQIPVPIFRMLGSDPIYQYDTGIGGRSQGVISLEPVYNESGKNKKWVEYFLDGIVNQPCLAFNYTQAGQENSFTWAAMHEGLEMQFALLDSLRNANKIRVETLGESGAWFRQNFKTTPTTAFCASDNRLKNVENQTVWFNSRYYRANLMFENDHFRFRDIHLFDENVQSPYLTQKGEGNQFKFFTLPLVDGNFWSSEREKAGLYLVDENGEEILMEAMEATEVKADVLQVKLLDNQKNIFQITFYDNRFEIKNLSKTPENWALELKTAEKDIDKLPFRGFNTQTNILDLRKKSKSTVDMTFQGTRYTITLPETSVEMTFKDNFSLRILPQNHKLTVDCRVQ